MLSKREQYPAWVERIYGWLWRRFGIKWDGRFAFGATMVQIILMWKTGLNNCKIKEKLPQSNEVLSTPLAPWMNGLSERLVRVSKEVLNQYALKCPVVEHDSTINLNHQVDWHETTFVEVTRFCHNIRQGKNDHMAWSRNLCSSWSLIVLFF